MGRYYQTAQPEFVQDIMYRPPWELAKEVLAKEQGDYDTAVAKANLFGDVDIEHMDTAIERENAARIQQQYAQRADELVNQLQTGSADDWRKALPSMTKMSRELAASYKTGDISKIEGSAKAYTKFQEDLKSKDPAIKNAAQQYFLGRFNQQARGSLDNVFAADSVYDKKDLTGEFLKELPVTGKPDVDVALKQFRKDGYINTAKYTKEQLSGLKDAYGKFIQAKGYEPYLQQQQDFQLGTYFDPETGKLMDVDDKRSSLNVQGDYVATAEYTKKDKDLKSEADQWAMMHKKRAWDLYDQNQAAKANIIAAPSVAASANTQEEKDVLNRDFNSKLVSLAGSIPGVKPSGHVTYKRGTKDEYTMPAYKPMDIQNRVNELLKNPRLTKEAKAKLNNAMGSLNALRNTFGNNQTQASYKLLADNYGVKIATAAQKGMAEFTKDPRKLYPKKGTINVGGKVLYDVSLMDVVQNPEKYDLPKGVVDKLKLARHGAVDSEGNVSVDPQDYKDFYIDGSDVPVLFSNKAEDWDTNATRFEHNVGGVPIIQQLNNKVLGIKAAID